MLSSAQSTAAQQNALERVVIERIVRKRGRECSRCGGRHHDSMFKMCEPCRDITAAWHQAWRLDHKARKLCTECVQKKGKQTIRCEFHREYNNEFLKRQAHDQRAKGLCAWGRCQNASEYYLCDTHREQNRSYRYKPRNRRWAA